MNKIYSASIITLCIFLGGCIQTQETSDTLIIEFASWIGWINLVICVVAVVVCVILKKRGRGVYAIVLLCCTVVYGGLVYYFGGGYILLNDKVMIERFGRLSSEQEVMKFADVERVTYSEQWQPTGRGQSQDTHYAHFHHRSGVLETRRISTLWQQATPHISEWLDKRGVRSGPDMRAFGFDGDDPMEVSVIDLIYRYDSGSAEDRFSAFAFGGGTTEMRREDGSQTLSEALKAKSSVLGTWKMRVEDGDRWASITIEFKRSNQFYFEAKGHGDSSPVTLKGSFSEGEFSLGFEGEASNQSWEISR